MLILCIYNVYNVPNSLRLGSKLRAALHFKLLFQCYYSLHSVILSLIYCFQGWGGKFSSISPLTNFSEQLNEQKRLT